MRWLIPASVLATGLGILVLYVPLGKAAALIVPPEAAYVVVLVGAIGMVVGVARGWSRSSQLGGVDFGAGSDPQGEAMGRKLADATALAGLAVALVALLAVGSVFVVVPILVSILDPDPCRNEIVAPPGGAAPSTQTSCLSAHPGYYQFDPVAYAWSTPGSRISRTVDSVAGPAEVPLALAAALISWLALAMGSGRRRTALLALTISSVIVVGQVFWFLIFVVGGGD